MSSRKQLVKWKPNMRDWSKKQRKEKALAEQKQEEQNRFCFRKSVRFVMISFVQKTN